MVNKQSKRKMMFITNKGKLIMKYATNKQIQQFKARVEFKEKLEKIKHAIAEVLALIIYIGTAIFKIMLPILLIQILLKVGIVTVDSSQHLIISLLGIAYIMNEIVIIISRGLNPHGM